MKELFEAAFSSVNIFPTILFLLIIVYWISVLIGALDMDFLNIDLDGGDVDVDIDADADLDIDTDADIGADAEVEGGVLISLNSILTFFNLGKVPFMILMSFFVLSLWSISILSNYILHNQSTLLAVIFLIPNIIASLLISKVLTTPFALVYTRMAKNNEDAFEYQGKICTMVMPASENKIGQAEINRDGSTYRVNVLTKSGTKISKGESGLIINFIKEKKCYLVEPYKK